MSRLVSSPASMASWLVLATVPPLLAIPQLGEWMFFDDAVYATVAREMLRGGAMYVDAFDHKPPVIHLWYATVMAFGGGSEMLRFSLFVSLGLTAVLLARVARAYFDARVAFLVGLTFAVSTALVLISANASVEQVMLLPMTASLLAYTRASRTGRLRDVVMAGALGALAVWTKPLALFNLAAIAIVLVAVPGELRAVGRLRRLVALGVGSAAVSGIALALLAATGVLGPAYDALVTFNLEYGRIASMGDRAGQLVHAATLAGIGLGPLWPPALWGAAVLWRERSARGVVLLTWAGASMTAALTTGFAFAHYFAHALPALALVAGAGYEAIAASAPRRRMVLGGADRTLYVHGRLPQAYVVSEMRPANR